jgi:hypothetical protein
LAYILALDIEDRNTEINGKEAIKIKRTNNLLILLEFFDAHVIYIRFVCG